MLEDRYDRLARACVAHPWRVLIAWLLVTLLAAIGALKAESVLHVGQSIKGSQSEAVEQRLRRDFTNPFTQLAVVAVDGQVGLGSPDSDAVLGALQDALDQCPEVGLTLSYKDTRDPAFGEPGQTTSFILIGLHADNLAGSTAAVPALRAAARDGLAVAHRHDPTAVAHVTSDAAFNFDLRAISAADSAKAEARAIPLTLILLLVAFGSLVAALIPVAIGVMATILTLGLAWLAGQWLHLSVFVLNVATMVGLGIGIDYGLFMVSRFREERRRGLPPDEAAVATVRTTGVALTYSGLTVMIGFAAMLIVPMAETRSIGLGGLVEVGLCVALSLTAVPALLTLLGDRLESGRAFAWLHGRWHRSDRWVRWSHWVMDHPKRCLVAGLIPLVLLTLPLRHLHVGIPDNRWLPKSIEVAQGYLTLEKMGQSGVLQPMRLIVEAPAGGRITDGGAIQGLVQLTDHLAEDARIAHVRGLVAPTAGLASWQMPFLLADVDRAQAQFPELFQLFVNTAGTATLLEVIPANDLGFDEGMALVTELRGLDLAQFGGLADHTLQVGGLAAFNRDFHDAMLAPFPIIVALVVGTIGLMLLVAFRSLLIPLKAMILNSLSVLAAFGATVLVFQQGYGASLFGLDGPTGIVIVVVPILVFCIVFGLSMDYEVFMLARIAEAYRQSGDNKAATAHGLQATGSLITSAALIMIVVFGAFAFADLLIVKMLGFGLAVAVLLDATLIRMLLVPAFMRLAGDWNWWPGDRRLGPPSAPEAVKTPSIRSF